MPNPTVSAADPYTEIAPYYDAEFSGAEADMAFFSRFGGDGSLLVLGCGSGRISRAFEDERSVTGLDCSPGMLARARTRGTGRYVLGDMRDFDLGVFSEIIVPNGAFTFLRTRRDRSICLGCICRALEPEGRLTIDVAAPDYRLLSQPHMPERTAWEGWMGEDRIRRTREVFRRPMAGRLTLVDRYYKNDTFLTLAELDVTIHTPGEIEWMLEASGFAVEAFYGDYRARPISETTPRLIARAIRL